MAGLIKIRPCKRHTAQRDAWRTCANVAVHVLLLVLVLFAAAGCVCSEVEAEDDWPEPPNKPARGPPLLVRNGGRGMSIGSGGSSCCRRLVWILTSSCTG